MSDLGELYQSVILDHNRNPRNLGSLESATGRAEGRNPLCGDELTVWVRLESDRIGEIRFTGDGCAISRASASLMTEAVKGKTRGEALALFGRFHELVTGTLPADRRPESLGKLAVFGGVSEFPIRVKCASLAWHTLRAALAGGGAVSTEQPDISTAQ